MADVAATPNPLPAQGEALETIIANGVEMYEKDLPIAEKVDNNKKQRPDLTPEQRKRQETREKIIERKKAQHAIEVKERFRLKPEFKDSADTLYEESFQPTWLWTLMPMPLLAYPLMKYHIKLTSCELDFGFNTSLTSMKIPLDEIMHVKMVPVNAAMFYGYGVRYNGKHWGYVGSGEAGTGIRLVVKNQNKKSWLKTMGYIKPDGPPQMLFFTCNDPTKFIEHFEKIQKDTPVVDAL